MSFLRVVRMALLALLVVAAIVFTVKNPSERVRIDLVLLPVRENVLLIEALLWALFVGAILGASFAVLQLLELRARLRAARRELGKVRAELTALRNLPLEEGEEGAVEGEAAP